MKIRNITSYISWLQDLKKGELIKHQPKRTSKHSEWYVLEVKKEGRVLK